MNRSTRSLVAAAVVGVAMMAAAEEPEVVAQAGGFVWYAADVVEHVQDTYPNQCDQDLARLVPGTAPIITAVTPSILCTYRIPYGEGIVQDYVDQTSARTTAPPSQRRTDQQIWAELTKRYPAKGQCAKGFASETKVGVGHVECVRRYKPREACPKGGAIRVPDGRLVAFTDAADERKCWRDTPVCPDGTAAVPRQALSGFDGCFRCPAGELDVKETLAWRAGKARGLRVLCRAKKG